jgi:hypothetical protein
MTPKEKAAELIVNYQLKCKSLNYDEAKQCALIAVDEILELLESINNSTSIALCYWYNEVKQEIEKL